MEHQLFIDFVFVPGRRRSLSDLSTGGDRVTRAATETKRIGPGHG
jgi:hypothetical protein